MTEFHPSYYRDPHQPIKPPYLVETPEEAEDMIKAGWQQVDKLTPIMIQALILCPFESNTKTH